jgi:hypothetical protein
MIFKLNGISRDWMTTEITKGNSVCVRNEQRFMAVDYTSAACCARRIHGHPERQVPAFIKSVVGPSKAGTTLRPMLFIWRCYKEWRMGRIAGCRPCPLVGGTYCLYRPFVIVQLAGPRLLAQYSSPQASG